MRHPPQLGRVGPKRRARGFRLSRDPDDRWQAAHVSPHSLQRVAITNALECGALLHAQLPGPPRRCSHHVRRPSDPSNRPLRWLGTHTTCAMHACSTGWRLESRPPKLPPGPVTAWRCLLRAYAHALDDQEGLSKRRIAAALEQSWTHLGHGQP
jgi:hypothetical protein